MGPRRWPHLLRPLIFWKGPPGQKPPEEKLVQHYIRFTEAQWAKIDQFGLDKLRQLINRWNAP